MWPLDKWVPVSVDERKQQKWNHLKFSILFAALLRFFFIRSFRFQFVPSLSNIDFQLLVSFFFFCSFGDSRLYSTCRTFDAVFTKSRNSFRLSATNCISQRGLNIVWHRSDGGSSCIPHTSLENWFIGLPAGVAGKQLLIRKSHERVRCVCVCAFLLNSV